MDVAIASIFNYNGLSLAEVERVERLLALQRTPAQQLHLLADLIEISTLLRKSDTNEKRSAMTNIYKNVYDLFQKLNEHGVQYLLIGGFAVNAYGHARNTGDLDLWVNESPENRKLLGKACAAAGIAGGELLADMDWAPGWTGFHLPNGFRVDIMGHLKAFTKNDFAGCFEKAEKINFDGIEVPLIRLDDLLKEKATVGRPKDLDDAEQLRKIDRERR